MPRESVFPLHSLLICWMISILGLIPASSVLAEDKEKLTLQNGDVLQGTLTGFENEQLRWELSPGSELMIPISAINRVNYPGEDLTPWWHPEDPVEAEPLIVEVEDVVESPIEPELTLWETSWECLSARLNETSDELWDWTKRLEFGGQAQQGNGHQASTTLRGKFEKTDEFHLMQIDVGGDYRESDEVIQINRWFIDSNVDYGKKTKWIIYLKTQNRHDERKNLNYQGTLSAGMGYRFYNESNKKLIVRWGPAVTHELFQGEQTDQTTADLFADMELRWPLHDRIQFEWKTTIRPGVKRYQGGEVMRLNTESSLLFQIDSDKNWYFKLGFLADYNSTPGAGNSTTDFTSLFSIVYNRN